MNNLNDVQKGRLFNVVLLTVVILAVFLAVEAVNAIKQYSYIGSGVYPTNVISVTGTGEVYSVPDTGSLSFSVIEEGKVVKDAQEKATTKTNAILSALKAMNIVEKDIKMTGYNTGPKYEWQQSVCPALSSGSYVCPPSKNVLIGYEVSQTVSVKIRKIEDSGNVLTKVGELGATNIGDLQFVVDDMDAVNAEARSEAIADAKAKAKTLSKSLGIRLVKIVNYSENGEYPQPMLYAAGGMAKTMSADSVSVAPQVPVGENKIVSNVTITFEVK